MATITTLAGAYLAGKHPSYGGNVKLPYLVEFELNFASAATAKGSALAAADVIETITIPANTVVLAAGFEVKTVTTGESADVTLHLGDAGGSRWVASFDVDAAAAGAHAPIVVATANPTVFGTADTIDVTIATATTAPTGGILRIYALMVDVADAAAPGLAAVGS